MNIDKHMMLITPNKIDEFVNTFYITLNDKCAISDNKKFYYSDSFVNDINIGAKIMIWINNVYDYIEILDLIVNKQIILKVKFRNDSINYVQNGSKVIISYQPKFLFGQAFRSIDLI